MILKKNTKKTGTYNLLYRAPYLFLGLFSCLFGSAQVANFGNLHIGDNARMHISSGDLTMVLGAKTTTSRTQGAKGQLSLSSSSSLLGGGIQFLDGFLLTSANANTFPLGQGLKHAPLKLSNSNALALELSYYDGLNASAFDSTLSAVSTQGGWNIVPQAGAEPLGSLTLSWYNIAGHSITGLATVNLADLTIAGFNGNEWVQIPSEFDVNSAFDIALSLLAKGSISTTVPVDLSIYTRFTLAKKGDCSPLVASSGITKTWNGSWSPSAPTISDPVVINAPFFGSLECNSLALNANITLTGTQSVEIVNSATGTGKIIMSSNSSLIQRASNATAPNVVLKKHTGNKHVNDYVYWGTPIQGNFFSAIDNAQALTAVLPAAFDLKYKYVSGMSAANGGSWQPLTAVETGRGFITRVKAQAPFITPSAQDVIEMTFDGVANNGNLTVSIANNPASLNGGTSHNLLANPYPSPIDAIEFLKQNSDVDGVVYLWSATTPLSAGGYSKADYIAYNLAGSIVSSLGGTPFNGKIASGQGFKVKALHAGSVTFTNCMRLKDNNSLLYRQADGGTEHEVSDRFKLNLNGSNGDFSQILIAYLPQATLGYDRMYDAGRNSANSVQLYSIFEGDQRRLSINARPQFEDTDIVVLGVSKAGTVEETFTIGIEDKEGVFESNQPVYLHDNVAGIYHDFSNGVYTFSSTSTALNNRFSIVYQNAALGNPDFVSQNVSGRIKNEVLSLTADLGMKKVTVYDMTGRLIVQYDAEGLQKLAKPFNHADGVYIAKIELDNGTIATQKLITQK